MTRTIIHLDMDAFYASVEVLDNPRLNGLPVIVGGAGDRGVVSAASYEARRFGVHSAQPMVTARRLCPQGVYLPVRMKRYQQVSSRIFEIFRRYTPLVEPLSLDEAFLDVTGTSRLFGSPVQIAVDIRRLVKEEIGLTVSAGVAPSKLVAKIASDMDKPDGLTVVPENGVRAFLDPLPIGKLWGVGRVTRKTLERFGVGTIGDLARLDPGLLERRVGVHGLDLIRLAGGEDDRAVHAERETKSIGAEETYARDIHRMDEARREILRLAARVSRRTRQHGFVCRTITLKVKYSDFKQITRTVTLHEPTDEARVIHRKACDLLTQTAVGRRPVRLLGISLSRLSGVDEQCQPGLFDWIDGQPKARNLNRALDSIADKYGEEALVPATLMEKPEK
jgi:DNA polymerase IV